MAARYSRASGEPSGAQASCLSGSSMPARAATLAIRPTWSVQIWWPNPREPEWIITTTWPGPTPKALAARSSSTSSTTWTSRKWLPEPRLPTCVRPRSRARRLTADASAPGITPPSSVCARSSSVAYPRRARNAAPSSASRSSSPSLSRSAPCGPDPCGTRRISSCMSGSSRGFTSSQPEPRPHQPHAAVDVEADAARRDHTVGLVHGRDAADGEPVAPVDVRHGDAGVDDAGQRGDVGHLLQRLLVARLLEQARVRVHASGHAHLVLAGDLVDVLARPLDAHGRGPAPPAAARRRGGRSPPSRSSRCSRASSCRVAALTPPHITWRLVSSGSPETRARRVCSVSSSMSNWVSTRRCAPRRRRAAR